MVFVLMHACGCVCGCVGVLGFVSVLVSACGVCRRVQSGVLEGGGVSGREWKGK